MPKAEPTILVTHSDGFHSDDVFACAALMLRFPGARVIRSRDPEVIAQGDIVFDVGGVYDPETMRFDHHQVGGAGTRPNNIPYAALGLVWKHIGKDLAGSSQVAQKVDEALVQPIDAVDNGIDLASYKIQGLYPYTFQQVSHVFNITWNESPTIIDAQFNEIVLFAQKILVRAIKHATDLYEAEGFVKDAYERATDKRIVELERNYPWEGYIATMPEPLFVVLPRSGGKTWKVEAVRSNLHSFVPRKQFPAIWAGKKDTELAGITGVSDAVFCHNSRHLVVAKSREGALKLAQLALNA